MSLSITLQPQPWNLADNPTELRLVTNNLYENTGAFARYRFVVTGIPNSPNQSLVLQWGDNLVNFLTKISPDDSGTHIGIDYPGTDAQEWADLFFIPALQGNYLVNRDFDVTIPAGDLPGMRTIDLTARNRGVAYNLVVSNFLVTGSGSITGALAVSGADRIVHPNFQSYVELHISRTTVNNWQITRLSQAHFDLTASFPLHQILGQDYYGSTLPDYGSSALKEVSNGIIKFFLRYGEAYGEPKAIRMLSTTATYYALKGGFGKDAHAMQNFFTQWVDLGRTMLTQNFAQKVSTAQPIFLTYLHLQLAVSFRVRVEINYTDGSNTVANLYNQLMGANNPSLWVIPCGYQAISLLADPAKTVSSYSIWVVDFNNANIGYSQTISFAIDTRPPVEESHWLYKNAFGAYEVVRCTGTVIEELSIEKTQAERHLPADYTVTDAASITTANTQQRQWQINTGYKSKAEIRQLIEMLVSPSVYWVRPTHFMPVKIQVDNAELTNTRSGRANQLDFTAVEDTKQKHYTHV